MMSTDELKATPQNELLGIVASALRKGKEVLNYPGKLPESIPLLGGMGAGDMLFGKGPELMEDMSYGSPPYKGTGWATQVDPRTVDLAFAPGVGTAASAALRGTAAIPKVAVQAATNEGRREFLKKASALGATTAASAAAPILVTKVLREGAPAAIKEVAPLAAKEIAPAAAMQAVKGWTPATMKSFAENLAGHWAGYNAKDAPKLSKALSAEDAKLITDYLPHPEAAANLEKYLKLQNFDNYLPTLESAKARVLEKMTPQQLDEIIFKGPENLPKHLADQGITPNDIISTRFHESIGYHAGRSEETRDSASKLAELLLNLGDEIHVGN